MGSPVRFAIHVPHHPDAPWAERELALRVAIAMEGLGWEHRILHWMADIEAFAPMASLCMHPQMVPKMSAVPSLACHWNPPDLFNNNSGMWLNSLSHDAYLVGSPAVAARLARDTGHSGRPIATLPFYPSSQGWALPPRLGMDSRFFYVGSNWDGRRYPMLLDRLAAGGVLALYGQAERWQHLKDAFVASLPFDGRSVIEQANRCGMGLCLHLPMHFNAGLPNMRIFELCAAGALIVADRHPFILENFGDCVLYVDMSQGEEAAAAQILEHGAWARANVTTGRAMARASQEIFLNKFSLERLLAPVPDLVGSLSVAIGHSESPMAASVILPVGPQGGEGLKSRLRALLAQTVLPAEIILSGPGTRTWLADNPQLSRPSVRAVENGEGEAGGLRAGIESADQEWVIFLPEGGEPFPDWLAQFHSAMKDWPGEILFSAPVLEPGPDLSGEMEDKVRFIQPLLDWRLADVPADHPAGMMVRRKAALAMLDELGEGKAAVWQLARLIARHHRARPLERVLVRVRAEGLPPPELLPAPDVDAIRVAPVEDKESRVPWTGHSDLEGEAVRHLPRLHKPLDFARLPGDRPCYLYGASRGGELLYYELCKWRQVRVAGFIDSRGDRDMLGLSVRAPERFTADELDGSVVIFANQYVSACFRRLQALFPDDWQRFEMFNAYPAIYEHCIAEERASLKT